MPLFWIVLGLSLANSKLSDKEAITAQPLESRTTEKDELSLPQKRSFLDYVVAGAVVLFVLLFLCVFFYPSQGTIELPGKKTYTGQIRGSLYHGEGELESESGFLGTRVNLNTDVIMALEN